MKYIYKNNERNKMDILSIIRHKRDGKILTTEEINFFIENYTNGNIKDYQASALLMAIYINGKTQVTLWIYQLLKGIK